MTIQTAVKTIAFSSLLGKGYLFKTEHGQRLFCDAKPIVFNNGNKAIIYDERGETVGMLHFDIVLPIQEDNTGCQFVELKDIWTSIKLYPFVETAIKMSDM